MNSTSLDNKKNKIPVWSVIIWLAAWQLLSMYLKSDILLVSPLKVIKCLLGMLPKADFWRAVGFTFIRINAGFLLATLAGIILGSLSYVYKPVRELLTLPVSVIKATPVASFIILVLIWIPSRNLSVFISFLMTFPIMYTNITRGLCETDHKMLEMTRVFKLPLKGRLRYVYIPQCIPYFRAACSLALGMGWKAGIAAEIIGLPRGSMGERLYEAKIYLNTDRMFAWSVTIIIISILFEKIVMFLIGKGMDKLEGR